MVYTKWHIQDALQYQTFSSSFLLDTLEDLSEQAMEAEVGGA